MLYKFTFFNNFLSKTLFSPCLQTGLDMPSDRYWHAMHGSLDKGRISTATPCRPKRFAKWAVLHCDSAHFALQNGPFYKPKRPVLQHTVYQHITQSHTKQPIKGPTAAHAPAPQAHVPHPLPNRTVPHRTAANAQPDGSLCTARHQSAHCHFVSHTLHFRPRCQAVRTNARLICHDGHFFRIRSHSFRLNY